MTDEQRPDDPDPTSGGQVSEGPSGMSSVEGLGGADAVPETPDNVPADEGLNREPDAETRRRIRDGAGTDGTRSNGAGTPD